MTSWGSALSVASEFWSNNTPRGALALWHLCSGYPSVFSGRIWFVKYKCPNLSVITRICVRTWWTWERDKAYYICSCIISRGSMESHFIPVIYTMSKPPPFWCCVPTCTCRIQEEALFRSVAERPLAEEASLSELGWKISSDQTKVETVPCIGGFFCLSEKRKRSRALGQERHRALLRGGSESSDWANRRGRTVAGMIILTRRTSEAKHHAPFTWEHPIRRVTDGTFPSFFGFFRFENGMGLMCCTLGRNYWHSGWQEINPVPFSIPHTGLAGSAKWKCWMLPPDRL